MQWIKARKTLPPSGKDMNLKIDNMPFSGRYWKADSDPITKISFQHFNVAGKTILDSSHFDRIYWLDESEPTPSAIQLAGEGVEQDAIKYSEDHGWNGGIGAAEGNLKLKKAYLAGHAAAQNPPSVDIQEQAEKWASDHCRSCNDVGYYGACECKGLEAAFLQGSSLRPVDGFQKRVDGFMIACFGEEVRKYRNERCHRSIEESLGLAQACNISKNDVLILVEYVFGRPQGNVNLEVGGVMVTLSALCSAHNIDMADCAEAELKKVWTKIDKIRAKRATRPKDSPLPQPPSINPSLPSDLVEKLREANPLKNTNYMWKQKEEEMWNACCDKLQEILNSQPSASTGEPEFILVPCDCYCHTSGRSGGILHAFPCCDKGFKKVANPKYKPSSSTADAGVFREMKNTVVKWADDNNISCYNEKTDVWIDQINNVHLSFAEVLDRFLLATKKQGGGE